MNTTERLHELARNLYWTWHPDVIEIFRDLDPELWREVNHNPLEFLPRLSAETIETKVSALALTARINHAFHRMRDYCESRTTWGHWHAGRLRANPVAYFSANSGCTNRYRCIQAGWASWRGTTSKAPPTWDSR